MPRCIRLAIVSATCLVAFVSTSVAGTHDVAATGADDGSTEPVAGGPVTDDIRDELDPAEIADIVTDRALSLDGTEIVAQDPAPLGPFPSEAIAVAASAATSTSAADGSHQPGAAIGIEDTFVLHSRPAATRTIYLDFDGEIVSGTPWNDDSEPIEAGRYRRGASDPDGGFTSIELDGIIAIWRAVAEDYVAWDVDVTTEDPGVDALSRTSPDDVEYGVRTIITPDYEWYSDRTYGGVAYLRSFSRDSDVPAWVFSANLGAGAPKFVAEAVSHEVGHSLGLAHDGVATDSKTSAYYSGHGVWAPIMGSGYYKPVTQFSSGAYPGATNSEDDLAIIDGFLRRRSAGALLRGDALPDSDDSSTLHSIDQGGATVTHALAVGSGPVSITVDTPGATSDLVASLAIRDPGGQVVATSSPQVPTGWSLTAALPAGSTPGTYTVEVTSVGWAPTGPDDPGFSAYASIGSYRIGVVRIPVIEPVRAPVESTAPGGGLLDPISPQRVLDTRSASGGGRLGARQNLRLPLAAAPTGTTAAVVNVVAVDPDADGWLSLTPCTDVADADRTSSINFVPRSNVANSVIVPLSSDGDLCIYASTPTHVVVDVTAWIGPSGSLTLDEIEARRVVDTRDALGIATRLAAGTPVEIDLGDSLTGDDIGAIALNVTAVRPSGAGFVTIDDCSGAFGRTSALNVSPGRTRGNNGVFALSASRHLCVSSSTATDLTLDVTGEFGTGSGRRFVPASPVRLLDTRPDRGLDAGASTVFDVGRPVGSDATIPAAASVNITAVRPRGDGFVTSWDCGDRPHTSSLNPAQGTSTANGALVPLSPAGTGCLYHSVGGHLVVDLAGWWI